jgi:putative transposase
MNEVNLLILKLVEQHTYKPSSVDYAELDNVCFLSKNLYNATLYAARQGFFENGKFRRYPDINKEFTDTQQPDYCALPRKVSKLTQQLVDKSIISYFGLLSAYKKGTIQDKPGLPRYLKKDGRQVVTYTEQAISTVRKGFVRLSGTNVFIPTKKENIKFVRVVPCQTSKNITVEVGYEQDCEYKTDGKTAAIDLGINNLATLVFTDREPIIYNGKPLKSVNQYYNKQLAELKSKQDLSGSKRKTTNKIKRLHTKRNNKVKDYMHKVSREITSQLVSNGVTTLVIGYNKSWKQDVNLGKKTNQNFVQIPFLQFVNMLTYKGALSGIRVETIDEAYTSKCSFLDNEDIKKHSSYAGKRVKRGLFKSSTGLLINADVNAAYNILRKWLQTNAAQKFSFNNCVEVCSTPSVFTVNYLRIS